MVPSPSPFVQYWRLNLEPYTYKASTLPLSYSNAPPKKIKLQRILKK